MMEWELLRNGNGQRRKEEKRGKGMRGWNGNENGQIRKKGKSGKLTRGWYGRI